MRKNILQDVIADKRKRGYNMAKREEIMEELNNHNHPQGGFSKLWIWLIAIFSVVFLVFSFSVVLSGATVKVTPRTESISLNDIFTADKRTVDIKEKLPFDVVVITESASKDVPATGVEEVQRKASGKIIVYNSYSSKSQKLVKNTRFESPTGKIYRIMKSISVPGTTVSEGEIIPGSIEAEVFADEPGVEYNTGLVDFTIPGLKGSDMYKEFYAKAKTPIAGGFSGEVKTVSDTDRESAESELRQSLEATLLESVRAQQPEGFILYEDGIFVDFQVDNDLSEDLTSDKATISQEGTLRAIMFDAGVLSNHIAGSAIEDFDGSVVEVVNIENLEFKLLNKDTIDLNTDENVSFRLSGDTSIVWLIDEPALKERFSGSPKRDFQKVMGDFLHIERAEVVIRPFWKKSFPDSVKKIKIEILTGNEEI